MGGTTLLESQVGKIEDRAGPSVGGLEQGLSPVHMAIRRTVLVAVQLHTIIQRSRVNARAESDAPGPRWDASRNGFSSADT